MDFQVINEETIMIYFEDEIDPKTYDKVQLLVNYIHKQQHEAIVETVASYRAVMLIIDMTVSTPQAVLESLDISETQLENMAEEKASKRVIHLPVLYGDEYGPDIEAVAEHNQLSTDEVIRLHTANQYLIYMLGFMPGFPFLGGLDERLHTPRRSEPRTKLEAGSVGIANNQTGLYPSASPGGWQIIGRTPVKVLNMDQDPMVMYQPGDYIKFYEIDKETYDEIVSAQENGEQVMEKWVKVSHEH
ncbi:inhibitor of KinA [Staphylococcus auricularis]|uniref:5-oxoprolinase subunit PxpB n=1 Tax=Staphylococcus auricularis TaxID=29379 RepID=A0AAP8PN67_9STAP|nr:5-oxoprolinase subunit PxpB [Staphylococcus auricularis]MBM0868021.1 5-oxoprolinase subunit PxpB [Staphylococcus auricularis]MCG7340980.1 5-oxoprolinase subunit PxpB [Staphylococcus auricularis]MDC6326839.1 5-oxoprolinase subunit PxpB [Staphylococcus auricularis]MDN4532716.1 5-oxoprolinase subunit PxpB [Staphylococcus auricularis]PNZ66086.1 allophanate hydrolase [Staphylococcus auricularis]